MRYLIVLTALCGVTSVWCTAPAFDDDFNVERSEPTADSAKYRLPTNVLPKKYVVELTPYFTNENGKKQFTFDGKVEINLHATEADVKQIVLHINEIEINGTPRLKDAITPLTEIQVVSIIYDVGTHKYTILLEKALTINREYLLSIQYLGYLSTNMRGFYRSSYEENGVTK